MKTPEPVIETHEGIIVVRDDLIAGGTKVRALPVLFNGAEEYVYASPVYGYAQIALAHCAASHGKKALIFCARRKEKHPRTLEAYNAGANVFQVDCGYMSVVKAKAKEYCRQSGACLLPFGLDNPAFINALSAVAARLQRGRCAKLRRSRYGVRRAAGCYAVRLSGRFQRPASTPCASVPSLSSVGQRSGKLRRDSNRRRGANRRSHRARTMTQKSGSS